LLLAQLPGEVFAQQWVGVEGVRNGVRMQKEKGARHRFASFQRVKGDVALRSFIR